VTAAPIGADVLAHRDWLLSLLDAAPRAAAAAARAALEAGDARVDAVYSHNLVERLPDAEAFGREVGRYFYAITGYAFVGRRVGAGTRWTGDPPRV
jgi:hypothetical protein